MDLARRTRAQVPRLAAQTLRYQVRLTDDAQAEWRSLAPRARRLVKARLRDLATDPFGRGTLGLCGYPDIVRAVADGYRVLFTIGRAHDGPNLVRVFRIRPRATAYVGYERTKT